MTWDRSLFIHRVSIVEGLLGALGLSFYFRRELQSLADPSLEHIPQTRLVASLIVSYIDQDEQERR